MIKIAGLDDQEEWLITEQRITETYFKECNEEFSFQKYNNVDHFFQDLEKDVSFDIYLLDIELPETNGIQIAKEIKQRHPDALIIYITGYVEYAVEAFEVNAYRYIPKTMLEEKLPQAYESLKKKLERKAGPFYVIETNSKMEKIEQRDIYYLKKEKKYVVLTKKDGESKVRASLDEVYRELEEKSFVKIDKSCIVNLRHLMKLENREVKMRNGVFLPISQPQLSAVKKKIAQYWRETC